MMKRRRNVPPALGMCVFSAIGLYGLCPRGTGFVQVYFQKTNPAGEAVHRLERHMDEMERPLRTDIAIPLLQSVGLFLNLCGDLPAGFQGDLSGFTHSKQISKTGVFPISIHRRGAVSYSHLCESQAKRCLSYLLEQETDCESVHGECGQPAVRLHCCEN